MAPARSSNNSSSQQNARVILAKNIQAMTAKSEAFMKAVDEFRTYNEETINEISIEIEQKRKELDELVKEYKTKEIDEKIKVDQEIRQYGYNAAINIIESNGKIAVPKDNYEQLNNDYQSLKQSFEKEVEKVKAIEKSKFEKELKNIQDHLQLKFDAEHAKVEASVTQKDNEIELLKRTVENLREELASQRALTKDVAMAAKQGAITQTFGKA